eukprot:gene25591-33413_t
MKWLDLIWPLSVFIITLYPCKSFKSKRSATIPYFSALAEFMFSGIIEDIGIVESLSPNKKMVLWDGSTGSGVELTVRSKIAVSDASIGCSIAVNGVCLTATSFDLEKFTVGLAPETLRRTNLGLLSSGSKVNIERALRADGRNSGHFVQGHVDGTGEILDRWAEGESLWMKVAISGQNMAQYIVPKGFVCIDGTSLTICDVFYGDDNSSTPWFTIMLVAHTQQNVIFPLKQIGDRVNIEVDVLAKMVEKSIAAQYLEKNRKLEQDVQLLSSKVRELSETVEESKVLLNEVLTELYMKRK